MFADVVVAAPPELPRPGAPGRLARVLPLVMSMATLSAVAVAFLTGTPGARNPTLIAFPVMMLVSLAVTAATGRGRRGAAGLERDRMDYLRYLSGLHRSVSETAAAQRLSLTRAHPEPDTLWTLIGGPGMWQCRPAGSDSCRIRVGIGAVPLASRLVAPQLPPPARSDPVTVIAVRRFLGAYSMLTDAPIAIPLRASQTIRIDGEESRIRALLRAMVCQLAVRYAPDDLLVVGVIGDRNRGHWDWLKWLPHNQHPGARDALGPARMVYRTMAQACEALSGVVSPSAVIVDADEAAGTTIPGAIVLEVGAGRDGAPLVVGHLGDAQILTRPDQLAHADALVCARRLAGYRVGDDSGRRAGGSDWLGMLGTADIGVFDPASLWCGQRRRDRLCAPIGITLDGKAVELDIKESAEHGMGPHGLCIGATGSGKSELLRTVALGMMARNSPEVLNLLLIDFKGGATFLDFAGAPHVAAVITNLAEEAPLVARMREALTGEINRRQQVLRAAGNLVSAAAYEDERRRGAALTPLASLFIVVDEFSELLSQHPDFADVFVAIGRLGRSLGMHLLLASQRLDESRLRGLEAHLSYRLCLKTLSANESRTVLGTLDAYELPNEPGVGFLRQATGELVRFQSSMVSGPLRTANVCGDASPEVRLFSSEAMGPVTAIGADANPAPSLLRSVLARLCETGPPAHQVWLPPLGAAPSLAALLSDVAPAPSGLLVPIGVVDRPYEQRRTPLLVDLSAAAGNVAVVGAPQSGKSTALCSLIAALAATHDPDEVQFYCLDFGGGVLTTVRDVAHVGAVAGRSEPDLIRRMIAELAYALRSRASAFRDHGINSIAEYRQRPNAVDGSRFADVFLVIDGWAALRQEFEGLEESITALASQGLSFGMHVMVSASRWAEIRPSLKDQIGTRIELRLGDPAESELDRRQARQVPPDRPGRGLSRDGMHMMIALPSLDTAALARRHGESAAPPIPLLPERVDYQSVVDRADGELRSHILIGLNEARLLPATLDLQRHPHLLVLGDNECGKSALLRTLCREIVRTCSAAQAQLFLVDFRRALLGVVESGHLGGYANSARALGAVLPGLIEQLRSRMPPPDVTQTQLRTKSWRRGPDIPDVPDIYVMVDDYDLVCTSAGNPLLVLLEYLPHATDLGLHLIVARRSAGAARAMFEPLLGGLCDFGCMALVMSGRRDDGPVFGTVRPGPLPPGRGVLVTRAGDEQTVQVAWTPPP